MKAGNRQTVTLHGHSVTYVQKGAGPVFLLVHGMAGSLETWRSVIDPLARNAWICRDMAPPARAGGTTRSDRWLPACAMS
jgi:pimeloyl-ACP methyl ester carboxylesterase